MCHWLIFVVFNFSIKFKIRSWNIVSCLHFQSIDSSGWLQSSWELDWMEWIMSDAYNETNLWNLVQKYSDGSFYNTTNTHRMCEDNEQYLKSLTYNLSQTKDNRKTFRRLWCHVFPRVSQRKRYKTVFCFKFVSGWHSSTWSSHDGWSVGMFRKIIAHNLILIVLI